MTLCLGRRSQSTHFNMEVILQGWLVKSPPENRTHGPLKLFRAKWRRRYFVLYEPPAADSLPGPHAALNYYSDETRKKKVGSIDLSHCEEVLSSLDSSHYKHLFALRTKHKNSDRTYYLAASSDFEMNKWVDSLCWVLGLMENQDQQARLHPSQNSQLRQQPSQHAAMRTGTSAAIPTPQISPQSSVTGGNSAPSSMTGSDRSLRTEPAAPNAVVESYIPLDECYSGSVEKTVAASPPSPLDQVPPPPGSRAHRSSIPKETAPLPPSKHVDPTLEHSLVYDHPPGSYRGSDRQQGETYDFPARSYTDNGKVDANENLYKMPRSLGSDPGVYDVPPTVVDDGIYKVPPRADDEDLYKVPARAHDEDLYKVPPSHSEQIPYKPPMTAGGDTVYNHAPPPRSIQDNNSVYKSPPPRSIGTEDRLQHRTGIDEDTYSTPPNREDLYVVPPSRPYPVEIPTRVADDKDNDTDDVYTVPPPPKPLLEPNTRDSNSSNGSHASQTHIGDSGFESGDRDHGEVHSCLPPQRPNDNRSVRGLSSQLKQQSISPNKQWGARKAISEDNILESVPPPPRPPRSDNSYPIRDTSYINLPSNAGAGESLYVGRDRASTLPSSNLSEDDSLYTFPRSPHTQFSDTQIMGMTPPPPAACPGKLHRYINAPSGFASSEPDNMYIPMSGGRTNEELYLPMQPQHPTRGSQKSMASATDSEQMYVLPALAARSSSNPSCSDIVPPPKMQPWRKKILGDTGEEPPETYAVFSTTRTRSFKRPRPGPGSEVPLPTRRTTHSAESSSDEDDDLMDSHSSGSMHRSADNIRVAGQLPMRPPMKSLHSMPPAPRRSGEVQYLDLELDQQEDNDSEKSPVFSKPIQAVGTTTPTDYKEIDFVKTKALSETKKDLENKRKSSEKSMDE